VKRTFLKVKKHLQKRVNNFFKFTPIQSASSTNQVRNFEIKKINQFEKIGFTLIQDDKFFLLQKNELTIKLRRLSSDIYVFSQVFYNKEYELVIEAAILNGITINTIIDAGANIGLTTLMFAQTFNNASFFCIEPDKENFSTMKFNLSGIMQQCKLYNAALWPEKKNLYLQTDFRDGKEWSLRVTENQNHSTTVVEAITLMDIINENGLTTIDILKIDIEGSEAELFCDSSDLSFLQFVKILALEIHNETNARHRIVRILKEKNFMLFEASETLVAINLKLCA